MLPGDTAQVVLPHPRSQGHPPGSPEQSPRPGAARCAVRFSASAAYRSCGLYRSGTLPECRAPADEEAAIVRADWLSFSAERDQGDYQSKGHYCAFVSYRSRRAWPPQVTTPGVVARAETARLCVVPKIPQSVIVSEVSGSVNVPGYKLVRFRSQCVFQHWYLTDVFYYDSFMQITASL
jgi:hypothetical protein